MPAPALWHASYPECASVALLSERRKRSTAVMAAAEMSAVDTIGKTIRRAVVPPKTTTSANTAMVDPTESCRRAGRTRTASAVPLSTTDALAATSIGAGDAGVLSTPAYHSSYATLVATAPTTAISAAGHGVLKTRNDA